MNASFKRAIAVAMSLSTGGAATLGSAGQAWAAPPVIAGASGSPPARVGRVARISGAVSFHAADQTTWSPAILNDPVTSGNAFWTEPSASAVIEVSGNRMAMDGSTEFDIATLDDHTLVASEPQGALYVDLRQVPPNEYYSIQSPRGAVQVAAAGRYEVVAGDTAHPTTVTVVEGAAQITGGPVALQVGAGQTATLTGADTIQGAIGPMQQDPFLVKMLAQDRPAPRSAVAVPPIVARLTGSEDLAQYGTWSETPQYGTVWYPQVESGWVPYRHGRWSYIAPWGWTWVDEAPWGFAPFHYGRWVQDGDRWGWVPVGAPTGGPAVAYPDPVYAPALVSFVAIGAVAGALIGAGSVGWVPLGPNEPYYPPYSRSLDYIRRVNGPSVRNVSQVITDNSVHNVTINQTVVQTFVNRGGATVVPAGAMAGSAPIAAAARPLPPQQLAGTRMQFDPPIRPTPSTAGVTPAIARRFNFALPNRPAAAGPPINPAAFRPAAPPGAAPGFVPPLRRADGPADQAPASPPAGPGPGIAAEPRRPGAEPARPGVLPALRPAPPLSAPPGPPLPLAPRAGAPRVGVPASPAPAAQPSSPPRPALSAQPGRPAEPVLPAQRGTAMQPGEPARRSEAPRPAEAPRAPEVPRPGPAIRPAAPPPRPAPPVAVPPRPAPPRVQAPHPPVPHPPAHAPEAERH